MGLLQFNNYLATPNKLRHLWEGVKQLLGLEEELLRRITKLEEELKEARKNL